MSMLSEMIRGFVKDPSVGKEYGKWGALNREQRKLIRLLCDTCDHFERAADDLAKEREKIMQTICDHCSPSFDKNGKPVCVFDAVNGYKAIAKVLKGNPTPAEQRSIETALISEICKGCNEEFPYNACEPSECRIRQRLINIPSDVVEHGEWKVEAYKEFAEAYKDQIKNYTGMFTDEGFYVSLDAVLNAVDFVCERLSEEMG